MSTILISLCKNSNKGNTNDEVMSDIGIQQGCPLSPTLFGLCIDELEHLDEIDMGSLCLINIVVAIFLYVEDVVLLSRSGVGL